MSKVTSFDSYHANTDTELRTSTTKSWVKQQKLIKSRPFPLTAIFRKVDVLAHLRIFILRYTNVLIIIIIIIAHPVMSAGPKNLVSMDELLHTKDDLLSKEGQSL